LDRLFQYFGRKAGKAYKKGRWFYDSLLGDEEEAIKAEFAFGYEMAKDIASQSEFDKDLLVKSIGATIKSKISSKHKFNFYTIKSNEVNAFALPGGFIFLTDSILKLCNRNEDEIAFIVCHEMAHVIKGHAMDRILAQYSINTLAGLVRTTGMLQNAAKQLAAKYLTTSYSRDNEFEADLLGTKLMMKSGYKSEGVFNLLERLRQDEVGTLPYFSSHPDIDDRKAEVKNYLKEMN
jgi:predicted Zn-dependent protease